MTEKVAVYIGTTHGPVRIERIRQEPVPLSEVFIGRGIEPLAEISAEYENFVRPGRPVDKAFGPFSNVSFRMDLSKEIKAGKSWQLAAFVAHGLQTSGLLAGPEDKPGRVIVLTGMVNADYKIEKVGYIPEKLDALTLWAADTKAVDSHIEVIIPEGETFRLPRDISLIEMSNAMSAFEFCSGMKAFPTPGKNKTKTPYLPIFLGVILAGGTGAYVFTVTQKTEPLKTEIKGSAVTQGLAKNEKIQVFEQRPPMGKTCANVYFGGIDSVLKLVKPKGTKGNDIHLMDSYAKSLCGLQFNFRVPSAAGPAKARLTVESGKFVYQKSARTERSFEGTLNWLVNLPDFQQHAFSYKLSLELKTNVYNVSHRVLP